MESNVFVMMKIRPVRYIALLFVFVFFTMIPNGRAQQPDVVDTSFFMTIDEANYDSLLHYFYMQQYAKSAKRQQSKQASLAYAEFDNIPDSVFVKRLHDLHMVVPLTYNSEVRAYIKAYVRIMSRRLDAMLSLSEYYFPMFEETLDRYGVPEELKYLTIVESAMNPLARREQERQASGSSCIPPASCTTSRSTRSSTSVATPTSLLWQLRDT